MSLLESMRSGSDSTFMQVVFGLVVVSFVWWGVGSNLDQQTVVASVNGESVTGVEFSLAYRMAEQQREGRTKKPLTEAEREALRVEVIENLIERKAVLQEARRLGLEVSDAEIANTLLTLEFLKDADGRFDQRAYENYLQRRGLTRGGFEEQIREELLAQKIQTLITLGASVSDAVVKQTYLETESKVDLAYVRLRAAIFLEQIQPTPEEIATWKTEHAAELKAAYDKDFERLYNQPEKLELSVIKLAVKDDGLALTDLKARLDKLRAELEGGGDFAALAARWSEDPSAAKGGALGEVRLTDLDEPAKKGLEGLQGGVLAPVVVGERDVRLYKVGARTPARVVSIEEAGDEIAGRLVREAAALKRVAAFAETELLPAWKAAGAPPDALLETVQVRSQTTGPIPYVADGPAFMRPPQKLVDAARFAAVGAVLPEVVEDNGSYWVAQVAEKSEADLAAFEEKKDEVREMALMRRRSEFVQAWIDDLIARAKVEKR